MKQDLKIITKTVCGYYSIGVDTIQSKIRNPEIVLCRQICHYFAKRLTKRSLSLIGADIGGKNHSSVLYGHNTIRGYLTYDKKLQKEISELQYIIENNLSGIYTVRRDVYIIRSTIDLLYNYLKESAKVILKQSGHVIILHISKKYIKLHYHKITIYTV